MATVIEEFIAKLGWEVEDEALDQFNKKFDKLKNTAKTVAIGIGAVTSAIAGLTVITNKQTAEMANQAASVGMSLGKLQALSGVGAQMGFEFERVVDLVEEMNNKIGEKSALGNMTAVEESVRILGLNFAEIKALKPEEQFIKLLDAAKDLEDQQEAVSAIDMLMGGEANKFLGFLRTQDESLADIIKKYEALNFLNEDGAKGAQKFNESMGLILTVVNSLRQQAAGLIGEALQPMINSFLDWVAANRELIKQKIREWVEALVDWVETAIGFLKDLWDIVNDVIDVFGGWVNSIKLVGAAFLALQIYNIITMVMGLVTGLNAAAGATKLLHLALASLQTIGIIALITALILILEDLWVGINGGESVLFGMAEEWQKMVDGFIKGALEIVEKVKEFWAGLVDEGGRVIQNVANEISKFGDTVVNALRKIPILGKYFGGESDAAPSTNIPPSGGASAIAAAGASNSSNTNNVNMNITQLPGESGVDLAMRVADEIGRAGAQAARNNDTGVER